MIDERLGAGAVLYGKDRKKLVWVAHGLQYASCDLPVTARVLDIGAGQDPHPAADIVVDKYLKNNSHRMAQYGVPPGLNIVVVDREGNEIGKQYKQMEWVEADITDLPFEDKSFDFIITRHILEHVPNLRGALKEIGRVGKSGYIEVPKYTSEMLFPQGEIHCWTFDDVTGQLIARSIVGFESPFHRIMHELYAQREDIKQAWAEAYHHFHACQFWTDQPQCSIEGEKEK